MKVYEVKRLNEVEDLKETPYKWYLDTFCKDELENLKGCCIDVGEEVEIERPEGYCNIELVGNVDRYLVRKKVVALQKDNKLYVKSEDLVF